VKVFVLWHMRPIEGQEDLDPEMVHIETEDKLCGVFSTETRAEAGRRELLTQPGFRDYPDDFAIDVYELDETQWDEGFVTE
jgi:homoserine kinase type II